MYRIRRTSGLRQENSNYQAKVCNTQNELVLSEGYLRNVVRGQDQDKIYLRPVEASRGLEHLVKSSVLARLAERRCSLARAVHTQTHH